MRKHQRERHTLHDQEARREAAEVDDRVARRLHEVVRVGAAAADPVWEGGEDEGRDDDEGEEVVEEGGGEDY